ncbi:glycogen debranching protein GlgX [Aliiglaciecola sp. CAU 1673]|uniref:glycogen debranching protein GlgX n=1 Tax=Aliiglaciecola sp. CAU 1673 TaxID=3032595 RepID=UPI0023DAB4C3|nr:glycogen debranching protein GlgX [Aliiglaciecola sp. CAU 1673]MDF2178759.1 glycogen debranching protein GlgX [Aliiglaciecola sp. CAU 1673]
MSNPDFKLSDGVPAPLGATLTAHGCNFAVHAPNASAVELCLFHADTEEELITLRLPAKTGKVWHGCVQGIKEGQLYGYRAHGKDMLELGLLFNSQKLLIDPYAKRINRPAVWNARQYKGDSQFMIPKAVICNTPPPIEPGSKPHLGFDEFILYEAHIKGMTQLHPQVPTEKRGKFLGFCQPVILEHLKQLGVTAVQLMPVTAFMSEPWLTERGYSNYWGYNPINFFSPDPRYAIDDPVGEFRAMVNALHGAGIEVILDVVFNHTAEGGVDGPMLSFKGLDNTAFYLFDHNEYGAMNYRHYLNNSGCGNSVNVAHPYVMKMVMDALRYWVEIMGVDGFRFDLAASLGRDPYEFSAHAGFFRALRQDPVLERVKLIAEPWDIGAGGYRLGHFPSHWHECNDKYRDTLRAFWRGDKGSTSDFATRLLGSRDIFPKGQRAIHTSVNMVTYHDGFTLEDLVSYQERHNEANGEQNRDGHGHNISANYGVEGATHNPQILALRDRQKRNMFATLLLSQGIPHVLGGDELCRTQKGNNNAYCQDNEISWLDWELTQRKQDFFDFCQKVIAIRKGSELLSNLSLQDDNYINKVNVEKVGWYRPDGAGKVVDDWQDANNQAFALQFKGEGEITEHWLILFNAGDNDVAFVLPSEPKDWQLELDTRYSSDDDYPVRQITGLYVQAYKSLSLLRCHTATP